MQEKDQFVAVEGVLHPAAECKESERKRFGWKMQRIEEKQGQSAYDVKH